MLPHPTVTDVHDATVSTVPLHRESAAVEGVRLHDSTFVCVRKVTGEWIPQSISSPSRSFGRVI